MSFDPSTAQQTALRKDAHLDLCATGDVVPGENSTLLECVKLMHCAMPELAVSQVSLSTPLFGKTLKAPLLITGMTGGTDRAGQVNRDLARVAEEAGIAFGVGSQRAMVENPSLLKSYAVRDLAPTTVVIGNIGLRQAAAMGLDALRRMTDAIGADGLALHLNPGQELTQPEGDRDFQGGYEVVTQLARAYGDRLLVKETGCGISADVVRKLVDCGVRTIDVSGLGGTSWVRVEQLRATGIAAEVGAAFSSWGIPTAAAIASARRVSGPGVTLIASGGLRTGLDVARALSLGANLGGMALPLFRAQQTGGVAGAKLALETILTTLRHALVLTGSKDLKEFQMKPKVVVGELKDWLSGS